MPNTGCRRLKGVAGEAFMMYWEAAGRFGPYVIIHMVTSHLNRLGVQPNQEELKKLELEASPWFQYLTVVYDTPEDFETLHNEHQGCRLMFVEQIDNIFQEEFAEDARKR